MSATLNLLDQYKKARGITSDNACAGDLGITRAAVSRWRNGQGHPEADLVATMCERTKESVAHWLPLIEAERARTPEAKKVWLRLAQMAAAITLAVGIAPTHAATANSAFSSASNLHGYTLCEIKKARRWIGTAVAVLLILSSDR